jgi:hypothetical protein
MTSRFARYAFVWALGAAVGCSDHTAGPVTPTCSAALASPLTLTVAQYVSIDPASNSGCVTIAANASTLDSAEYLLVPQSAANTFNVSAPFQLRTATLGPSAPAGTSTTPAGTLPVRFDAMLRALGRNGAPSASAAAARAAPVGALRPVPAPPTLGSLRSFVVCSSAASCSVFKTVGARVRAVGQHVAIYVDTLAPGGGPDSAHLDTLKQVFDTLLYPVDTAAFGAVSDLDGNGVVIALMTPVVNSLTSKSMCPVFIAGFFFPFDLDLSAPVSQSNHGEIFYSIVPDPSGTLSCQHTTGQVDTIAGPTFVHEFQHMINFAQHVVVRGASVSEDGWLDEGLSKYAEELVGRKYLALSPPDNASFSLYAFPDVDDAYKYLSATGDSPLLIEFDQGTLAEVGASWLFTRYVVDQFGDTLPKKLVQTTAVGADNVAAQTGHAFDTTVTRWGLANWVSDLPGFATPPELSYTSWHFRTRTYASLHQQDPADFPQPYPLVPPVSAGSAVSLSGTLRAGSGMYWRAVQGPGAPAFTLFFNGSGSAALPVVVTPRLNVIRIR